MSAQKVLPLNPHQMIEFLLLLLRGIRTALVTWQTYHRGLE